MSTSPEYTEYILELLVDFDIETRKMFGGVLLKVDDVQLGIILGSDVLYFKVTDKKLQGKFQSEGSEQFSYFKEKSGKTVIIKNWWSVPDKYMDNSEEINILAQEILGQY